MLSKTKNPSVGEINDISGVDRLKKSQAALQSLNQLSSKELQV